MSLSKPLFEFKLTTKDKKLLVFENYIFNKNQTYPNGNIYWRCKENRTIKNGIKTKQCPSSCVTTGDDLKSTFVSMPTNNHNHSSYSKENIDFIDFKSNLRKRVFQDKNISIKQQYKEELSKITTEKKIKINSPASKLQNTKTLKKS